MVLLKSTNLCSLFLFCSQRHFASNTMPSATMEILQAAPMWRVRLPARICAPRSRAVSSSRLLVTSATARMKAPSPALQTVSDVYLAPLCATLSGQAKLKVDTTQNATTHKKIPL